MTKQEALKALEAIENFILSSGTLEVDQEQAIYKKFDSIRYEIELV